MPWYDETVAILRAAVLDDAEDPSLYEFSDARLTHVLAVSLWQVYQQVRDKLPREYAIDVVADSIDPDPAGTALDDPDRDESFLNLGVLKAACTLQMGAARKAAAGGFAMKDRDLFVDTRAKASNLVTLLNGGRSYCKLYEDELRKYLSDQVGTAGAAVLGPIRWAAGGRGSRRPGWGGGTQYFGG